MNNWSWYVGEWLSIVIIRPVIAYKTFWLLDYQHPTSGRSDNRLYLQRPRTGYHWTAQWRAITRAWSQSTPKGIESNRFALERSWSMKIARAHGHEQICVHTCLFCTDPVAFKNWTGRSGSTPHDHGHTHMFLYISLCLIFSYLFWLNRSLSADVLCPSRTVRPTLSEQWLSNLQVSWYRIGGWENLQDFDL